MKIEFEYKDPLPTSAILSRLMRLFFAVNLNRKLSSTYFSDHQRNENSTRGKDENNNIRHFAGCNVDNGN